MKKISFIILSFIALQKGFGQYDPDDYTKPNLSTSIKNFVPAAPSTAALLEHINLSYENPLGKTNASFTLATLECNDIRLPIAIQYDYDGFKPQSDASSIGLGWNLNAGNGAIIKQIGGSEDNFVADALSLGLPQYPTSKASAGLWFKGKPALWRSNVCLSDKDLQPEIYYINLMGKSIKMFKDLSGVIYTSPQVNWEISGTDQNGYTIITESGAICTFDTKQNSSVSYIQSSNVSSSPSSAFYLTKIKHANAKDSIVFNYIPNNYVSEQKVNDETRTQLADHYQNGYASFSNCQFPIAAPYSDITYSDYSIQNFNDYVLSGITSKNMSIVFHNSFNRTDLYKPDHNKHKVDSLTLYNNAGEFLKRIVFNYDYFGNTSTWLKLKGIDEKGINSQKNLLNFDYYLPTSFPDKTTLGIDHWGYWNNVNNASLIPEIQLSQTEKLSGANREPNYTSTLAAALKTVVYPTKGSIEFAYEQNEYDFTNQNLSLTYYEYTPISKSLGLPKFAEVRSTNVSINYPQFIELSGSMSAGSSTDPPILQVELIFNNDVVDGLYFAQGNTSQKKYIHILDTGLYTLRITAPDMNVGGNGKVKAYSRAVITDSMKLRNKVGGLRIRTIKYKDGNQITKQTKFRYELPNSVLSSGILINKPTYTHKSLVPVRKIQCATLISNPSQIIGSWTYITRSSISYAPLSTLNRYHVFYSSVWIEDSAGGKQNNVYSYYKDEGTFNKYPFPPPDSKEELRGKLINQKIWDKQGLLIKETGNTYNFTNNLRWLIGMKCAPKQDGEPVALPLDTNEWKLFGMPYLIYRFWPTLQQSKESAYNSNGDKIEKITDMVYDSLTLNLKQQSFLQSDGKIRRVDFKYAYDFSTPSNVYEKMVTRHMINQVIETSEYLDNVLIYTKRSNYFEPYTNLIVPQNEETFKAGGVLESRITYDSYDATTGHLTQMKQTNGTPVALLWSAQNNRLMAKVSNALPIEVFYENFETPINTNTQFHTGEKSLVGDYTCTFTKPNTKTYIVDYWSFDGTNWNYIKKNYTNGMSLTEGNNIDNVRIYPQDAQMISYTYKTGTGITSEEEPNGIVAKYEYDDFYRLVRIRDQYNNIVKTMDYNYKP
jgi:YD repeat-containing protein